MAIPELAVCWGIFSWEPNVAWPNLWSLESIIRKCISKMEEGDPCNPVSAFNLSLALYRLGLDRFERIMDIPGHSPIPKSLFWARRALKGDPTVETNDLVIKFISMVENEAKSHWTNSRKEAGSSPLKRCIRFLGAWYCGKECQVQHWKAGNKFDCIKS